MSREGEGWILYKGAYPGRPRGGATGPPAAPVGWAHWSPEGGRQAPLRACGQGTPSRPRGGDSPPVAPPIGRPGHAPLYKHPTPIPSSFEPENFTKNPEKKEMGEEKESGEALPDCALVICKLGYLAYVFFHWYCRVI